MHRPGAQPRCFADLANAYTEGTDYRVYLQPRPGSTVAIVAPHGGGIEFGTSEIARAIAGDEFNLYLFEGCRPSGNYKALHLTSHWFDEPRCLGLLAHCDHVLTVHGCRGDTAQVLIGGLDEALKIDVAETIQAAGTTVRSTDHSYMGREPKNICNRGRRGVGVQLELTRALRLQRTPDALIRATRGVLLAL
jgi:phage replication-related protein YjqB (UPF0714/DUF867 family)